MRREIERQKINPCHQKRFDVIITYFLKLRAIDLAQKYYYIRRLELKSCMDE